MKSSRRYFGAVVLILMLATPMFAGDIHTMNPSTPPSAQTATEGDMHTGVPGEISTGGSVTDAAVALIQSVLSLL